VVAYHPGVSFPHEALAVVLQVRRGELCVLLWRRARPPQTGRWALPGGVLGINESLDASITRHLAAKVDVTELSHLEQLQTMSQPRRYPGQRVVATAYLGLVPTPADPQLPDDTRWHGAGDLPQLAFDHGELVTAGWERLRAKLSYTNLGFALAPPTFTISELRSVYAAALGYVVSATNLHRILARRHVIEPTGKTAAPGRGGGRPAAVYRFRKRHLVVTDAFATLRPPRRLATT
jgi:ADP-ribose pyrophosphatase YjhB (NUDIX family)